MAFITCPYPISKVCPCCGGSEFGRAKPATKVAFTDDRVCKACGTRYTLPTPRWASILFVIIGIPGILVGLSWFILVLSDPFAAGFTVWGAGVGTFFGALCIGYGIWTY